ncbi:protein-L-isoaspartate(D-aspartate) O-methyltransferase [Coralloluteibacterium stylophorae]|uniref:Protein-L-isoaspartate O-methyltransferase n=2 Tax=Coralloluteibacterium stylophorae TaxID=1776034 RepID=A0A8J7VV89_9GAMM|nr:protein-L-isoaspartate(D-aspartate) O-methyltransferase [Coralloluteibacterium stylophorae]MBS7459001.1 protein-L-isoaspartate(D-aspartate) O-methyltransferase [Coralloluteibacterium stylophorae]
MSQYKSQARGLGMTSQRARDRLIERLREAGIRDERVLLAMASVPRHLFIDEALASRAYEDTALPIGNGQTISQPWVVARMTEALLEAPPEGLPLPRRVLEVGTGSGYQAAVLAALGIEVFSIERIDELLRQARRRLRRLGFNVRTRHDDGRVGWDECAPFDGIIVTAGGALVDPQLLAQLGDGGTLVAPVGSASGQQLLRLRRQGEQMDQESLGTVVFVPLLAGVVSA